MDQQWILLDERTGLHVSWYFWLRVLDEVNRSTRYGTPFALLLLEATVETPSNRPQRQLAEAANTVPQAIRSTDLGGIIAPSRVRSTSSHSSTANTTATSTIARR